MRAKLFIILAVMIVLFQNATQTVLGTRLLSSALVLVGEQPGHEEDLQGKPFVGPAGRALEEALGEGGIDRAQAYVTNVVKHFKWVPRGKGRLHGTHQAKSARMPACNCWAGSIEKGLQGDP